MGYPAPTQGRRQPIVCPVGDVSSDCHDQILAGESLVALVHCTYYYYYDSVACISAAAINELRT